MAWWDEKAARIQRGVISDELAFSQQFTQEEARRATVHARQDMVLLVSHLSAANHLLASIRFMLLVLIVVVLVIGTKIAGFW